MQMAVLWMDLNLIVGISLIKTLNLPLIKFGIVMLDDPFVVIKIHTLSFGSYYGTLLNINLIKSEGRGFIGYCLDNMQIKINEAR